MRFEKLLPPNSRRRAIIKKVYEKIVGLTDEERRYLKWINNNEPTNEELENQRKTTFKLNPKISIVVPVYNTPSNFFDELVKSLQAQTYSNWELCLADGSPTPCKFMESYLTDSRIKYKVIGENKGISGNTNEALSLVTGDFIGLLDHDDLLPSHCLYEVVKAINENEDVQFLYTDEDKLETIKGPRYGVFFKPDFSQYTLNSANYICHFSVFKKELMDKLGGFRSEYDGSQDFDIVSRASELTDNIVHIAKPLYHWRAHKNSTAQNADSKPYAFEVGKNVIKDHIKRSLNTDVIVEDGLTPGSYEIRYKPKENYKVSIIIDSQNPETIEEKLNDITYKNIEIIKGLGLEEAIQKVTGEFFIIIDDTLLKIDKPSFIEDLVGIAQDYNVGIVGTKLYDEEDHILHSGIIVGINGVGDYVYKGAPKNAGTYMQRLTIIHNVSSVYYRYAMIRKAYFDRVNGFEFNGINRSIDFSLKMLKQKLQIVQNSYVSFMVNKLTDGEKVENEEEQLLNKWKDYYDKGDIYYSPNLSKDSTEMLIDIEGKVTK